MANHKTLDIPRRIILQGNRAYATTFIGAADKFAFMVSQEAKARKLKLHSAAREIAPGIFVKVVVTRHLLAEERFVRHSTIYINATVSTPEKKAGQIRRFMCLCGSCLTLGIVDSRQEADYSAEVTYNVLVCSRDKVNANKLSYPNRKRPHTRLPRDPEDIVLAYPGYMMMVPAQSSDGALYEVGELVVLIPHPFGIYSGTSYRNTPFMQACSPLPAGQDPLYGACDIDASLGAVIVPIEIKGVAEYYNRQFGKPLRIPHDDPGGSTCPARERWQIPQTWPFGTYREGDQMTYVDAYDTFGRYHLAYATIEVADRNSRNVTIKFIDSGQEAPAYTLANREAKKIGGAWDMTPLDSANAGHIYTAVPLPGDSNQDIYVGENISIPVGGVGQAIWRITHDSTIAVVLVGPGVNVVLGIGRKTLPNDNFVFPVRHEAICLHNYSDGRYFNVVTGVTFQHGSGMQLTRFHMEPIYLPRPGDTAGNCVLYWQCGSYGEVLAGGDGDIEINGNICDSEGNNSVVLTSSLGTITVTGPYGIWSASGIFSESTGRGRRAACNHATHGDDYYFQLQFASHLIRRPYTFAEEYEDLVTLVGGSAHGKYTDEDGDHFYEKTISGNFTFHYLRFAEETVSSGYMLHEARRECYYYSPTRPQITTQWETIMITGVGDTPITHGKCIYKMFLTSNAYDLNFNYEPEIEHTIPSNVLPPQIVNGIYAVVAREVTLRDVVE